MKAKTTNTSSNIIIKHFLMFKSPL